MSLSSNDFELLKKKVLIKIKRLISSFFLAFLVYPKVIMFTQNKKKFHIIGSNPKDFFDMTVEATEILLKSDIIILSKNFHKTFFYFLRENNKKFIFKEDLSKNEDVKQWEKIFSLFKKFTSLSYLISGDPYFNYKNDLEVFLKKKKN